jgi:hypothetical protein
MSTLYEQVLQQGRIEQGLVTAEELDNDPDMPEVEIDGKRMSAGTALDVVRTTEQAAAGAEQEGRAEIKAGLFDFVKSTAKTLYVGTAKAGAALAELPVRLTDNVLALADAATGGKLEVDAKTGFTSEGGKVPFRVGPSYDKYTERAEAGLPELTPAEKAGAGITQFMAAYAANPIKTGWLRAATTDFAAFRQGEGNLANILTNMGVDPWGVSSMLSAKTDDGFVDGRMKNVFNGILTDGAIRTIGLGVNLFKNARAAYVAGDVARADELLDAADEALKTGLEREAPDVAAQVKTGAAARAPSGIGEHTLAEVEKAARTREFYGGDVTIPLDKYSQTYFRETNVKGLSLIGSGSWGKKEPLYLSATENLAKGQGDNVGVLLEMDAKGLKGTIETSKPSWQQMWKNGEAEVVARGNIGYPNFVKKITIDPSKVDNLDKALAIVSFRFPSFVKETLPDGRVVFTRPAAKTGAAAAEAATAELKAGLDNTVPLRAAADPIIASPEKVTAINTAIDAANIDPTKLQKTLTEAARTVDFGNPAEASEFFAAAQAKLSPTIKSVSWKEQAEFAATLGMRPDEVKRALEAGVVNPTYIAAANAVNRQAENYLKTAFDTGDEKEIAKALIGIRESAEDMRRFQNISGRTLNFLKATQQRSDKELDDVLENIINSEFGGRENLRELAEAAKIARGPKEIFNLADLSLKEKTWGSMLELVNNNLLSSVKTVMLQFTGVPRLLVAEPTSHLFAAAQSAARNAPAGERVYFGEVGAMIAANVDYVKDMMGTLFRMRDAAFDVGQVASKDGLVPAAKAAGSKAVKFISKVDNTRSSSALAGAGVSRRFISADTWGIGTQPSKLSSAMQDALGIPPAKQMSLRRKIIDAVGSVVNAPRTVNALIDVNFTQNLAQRQMLYAQATRTAMDEVGQGTLQRGAVRSRVAELVSSPEFKATIREDVNEYARRATFSEELGPLAEAGEKWLAQIKLTGFEFPAGKFFVPFYRAGANITKQGLLEYSPLAPATRGYGKLTGRQADVAAGRAMLGTATAVALAAPALTGNLTGPGPKDKAARDAWLAAGFRPYSYHKNVGTDAAGNRKVEALFSYQRFEPIAYPIALVATGIEKLKWTMADEFGDDDGALGDYFPAVVQTLTSQLGEKNVLFRPMHDFVELIGSEEDELEDRISRFTSYQLGKFVPNAFRDIAGAVDNDPARKGAVLETRDTVLDVALSKIPFLSKEFGMKRNRWGDPIYKDNNNFLGLFDDAYIPTAKANSFYATEIDREIEKLAVTGVDVNGEKVRYPDAILAMPNRTLPTKAGGIRLNSDQYARYLELENSVLRPNPETGEEMTMRDNLNYLVTQSPIYKEMLPEGKAFTIKQWSQLGYSQIARYNLLLEDADLQAKVAKAGGLKSDKYVAMMGGSEADQATSKEMMNMQLEQLWQQQTGD